MSQLRLVTYAVPVTAIEAALRADPETEEVEVWRDLVADGTADTYHDELIEDL